MGITNTDELKNKDAKPAEAEAPKAQKKTSRAKKKPAEKREHWSITEIRKDVARRQAK